MKPSIMVSNGRYFDLEQPGGNYASCFDITVIASALSKICRFTGHCSVFYSVAQHSWYVSHLVPPEHALDGLMHDAHEAFVGDVSAPLKALLPDYQEIERRVEAEVRSRFGLAERMSPEVKHGDLVMLATEARDMMGGAGTDWPVLQGIQPMGSRIVAWDPDTARQMFIERFVELTGIRVAA